MCTCIRHHSLGHRGQRAMGHTSSLPLEVSMSLSPGNHSSIRCSMLSTTEQSSLGGEGGGRERREGRERRREGRRGKEGGNKERKKGSGREGEGREEE